MNNKDVIYFSVNNWFSKRDYPNTKNFRKWLGNDLKQTFSDDVWAKENKLCIYYGNIDMSFNYTVAAPLEWVKKNCPELLSDKEYSYDICEYSSKGETRRTYTKKYSDFVYQPNEDGSAPDEDRFGMPFREYCEENFGSKYYETHWWGDEDDEDEDEENKDEDEEWGDEDNEDGEVEEWENEDDKNIDDASSDQIEENSGVLNKIVNIVKSIF